MKSILILLKILPFAPVFSIATLAEPYRHIDKTIHHLPDDRRVIIERIPAINLPAPPAPAARPVPEHKTAAQLAELAAKWRADRDANPTIHATATVYRLADGTTATHIDQFRVNDGPLVSFWSGADFSLLAHPGSFVTPDGRTHYSMMLLWTSFDVGFWNRFVTRHGLEFRQPAIPEFENSPATWFIDGKNTREQPDQATLAAIQFLHDHHNQNLAELQTTYARLQAGRAAIRAELAANPPQPRDIHFRVSRLTREQAAAWHRHAIEQRKGGAK